MLHYSPKVAASAFAAAMSARWVLLSPPPETREQMQQAITSRGYSDFYLMDVNTIKHVAVSCFNNLWMRVEQEASFELKFRENAEHLLKDFHHIQLENELILLEELKKLRVEQPDG
jgi:hypothetical protein